jgi:sugar lactone lactonase YvrE
MQPPAELTVDARCGVGESPVWDRVRQCLWWVDIAGQSLWCWHSRTGQTQQWPTPEQTGCIALLAGSEGHAHGQWVAAMETGVARWTPMADGTLHSEWLSRLQQPEPGMRFNDGRCDRQGRFRAGTMVMDMSLARAAGRLYALDTPTPREMLAGFLTPNGMAFSPDGRTLYVSDSHPSAQLVWSYSYDTDSGIPHTPRVFIDFSTLPGRPDGAAVDADGCYWVCGNDAGLVHRFTPQGVLDRSLAVPVKKPAMCAFGGSDLRTLFVTSIRPAGGVSDQPLAGGVFSLRPGVAGLDEPFCVPG